LKSILCPLLLRRWRQHLLPKRRWCKYRLIQNLTKPSGNFKLNRILPNAELVWSKFSKGRFVYQLLYLRGLVTL
jgi:hypothetical protein